MRFRKFNSIIQVGIAERIVIRLMRRLEMTAHQKRFRPVLLTDPCYSLVCDQIRGKALHSLSIVSGTRPWIAAFNERRVAVLTLIIKHRILVETLWLRLQMPLTHKSRSVAALLQHRGQRRQSRIKGIRQRIKLIAMAVHTRQDARTARSRQRIRAETIVKHSPLRCQTTDIGILGIVGEDSTIYPPCLRRVVVAENKQYIRASVALLFCLWGGIQSRSNSTHGHKSGNRPQQQAG